MFKKLVKKYFSRNDSIGKQKYFGIGLNKTGTTSLKKAMEELGFVVGDQRSGEVLMDDWAHRDFKKIVEYCKTAEFFQDAPFSKPYTYVILDHEFPGSKFILTIRDSADQWYNSLTRFHGKLWAQDSGKPTKQNLKQADYIYKGRAWVMNRYNFQTPESKPYKKDVLLEYYNNYIYHVKEYFRHRPDDLLVLNVSSDNAFSRLCEFLEVESDRKTFPWENKTD